MEFEDFDNIITLRKNLIEEFSSKYNSLKKQTETNIKNIYYGKESLDLGHFCPSLIIDKISNFKRDVLKKALNKNSKNYVSYEVDKNGKLLRIKDVNQYDTCFETYIIRQGNEEISITFLENQPTSSINTVRTIFNNDGIIRCDFISDYSVRSEIYNYENIQNNHIKCKEYYYVQNLKGSDRSKKPGEFNSPAKLSEIDIYLTTEKQIKKIEYHEIINGKRCLSYTYES